MFSEAGYAHGVPAMAASIRLRVGLGGALMLAEGLSSCSGRRVFPCLIILGGGGFVSLLVAVGCFVRYGDSSASGGNMSAFLVYMYIAHGNRA